MADTYPLSGYAHHPIVWLLGLARAIDRKSLASVCTRATNDSQIIDQPRKNSHKTFVRFFIPFGLVRRTPVDTNILYVTNHSGRTEEPTADTAVKIVQAFDYRFRYRKSDTSHIFENLSTIALVQNKKCLPELGSAKRSYYIPHGVQVARNFKIDLHKDQQLFGFFPIDASLPLFGISLRLFRSNSRGFATRCISGNPQFPDGNRRGGGNSDSDPGDHESANSHQSCSEGGTSSPRLPPGVTSLSQGPALANSVQYAHSLIIPGIGRHFAMHGDARVQRTTLATVKPPRNRRTRLREDV